MKMFLPNHVWDIEIFVLVLKITVRIAAFKSDKKGKMEGILIVKEKSDFILNMS